MYVINNNIERPDPDLIQKIRSFPTPVLSDAMGRYGAMSHQIKPVSRDFRMAGPAYTVKSYVKDNLMVHYALDNAMAGDILVVDSGGYSEGALWGELASIMARKKGLGGIVLDAGARDTQKIIEIGFPVFSRSVIPAGTLKDSPGSVNVPVHCGGIAVNPGDIVVGDADGVVVIPMDGAGTVLEKAGEIIKKEKEVMERMSKGETLFDILGLGRYFEGDSFIKRE
jgi:4-hydroxy-4-methyl-2-oxoglutarate aldolase